MILSQLTDEQLEEKLENGKNLLLHFRQKADKSTHYAWAVEKYIDCVEEYRRRYPITSKSVSEALC